MTKPRAETLESERTKLYVTDAELIRFLGVPERLARATIQQLESKAGFPRKQALWGNRRYWPAVKSYLDRINGLTIEPLASRSRHG
jgi:hypothetical protein